jgi:adenylosuccinate lyase
MQIDLFDCVSPLDFRYYGADEKLFNRLRDYVSERAAVAAEAMVEAALAKTLAARGVCSEVAALEIAAAAAEVTPDEVAREEARIHHNIRALVNCIRARVSDAAKPYVHFTATSFDIMDTAVAWRYRRCADEVIVPDLKDLLRVLIAIARREKDTLQMGRTHGQHAVPITFGFAIAEYVSRLGNRIEAIGAAARNLRGKMSGAVGAYNASRIFFADPEAFEREVLAQLGLQPSTHSTQIVEPEYLADFLHALISCFGVLANLADDLRQLQRTEIAEVGEAFDPAQVGSSTMPHKRNPWNFEHVKSMWKRFMPQMVTMYLDQISEHQRDLTNSASQRFVPEVIVGLMDATQRLTRFCGRLVTDREHMRGNFDSTAGMVAAEPAYILLAAHGHPDAHEAVRRLTLEAENSGRPLWDVLSHAEDLQPYLESMSDDQLRMLRDPEYYSGIAAEKAAEVCDHWEKRLLP